MSVTMAKLKLPMEFIQNLYKDFNEKTANKILQGMLEERCTTLRVNTLKTDTNVVKQKLKDLNIDYEEVDFYKDALIIKNKTEKDLEKLEIYKNGEIYLQSLSSMIPPIILNPKPNESVLDLAASPGSKTTQMGCMMENKGYILANEIDKIRCDRLKFNIEMQGIEIAKVCNNDGSKIDLEDEFDKVLLDVPCSGEGRFLVNKISSYNTWSERQVLELSKLQRSLFESGYKALKKGGTLVYSTCTLNKKENEEIIDWALRNFNLEILDININLKEVVKPISKGFDKNIEKAIRILPSKYMEGFFVCLLKKI